MDISQDQINQLQQLGIKPKVNLIPLFSISSITLLSIGGLILLKTKTNQNNPPILNPSSTNQNVPSPTQVPKSIQHYLLASQQYFTQALEAQNLCKGGPSCPPSSVVNYLNQAILAASDAIKTSPSDYRGYEQRAKIYQALLDSQPQLIISAISDYQQAQKLNSNSADLTRQLASLYAKKGDLQNTLNYLSATVSLEPTKAQNFYDLARIQQQAGLLPDALDTYNRLIPLITDSTQKLQVETEKSALEKLVAQSSSNTGSHTLPISSPSPAPIQTDNNIIQASVVTGPIIAAPETSKNISVKDQTESNSLSGTATLPSGQKQLIITNSQLNPSSQVYLTIVSGGKNQNLELLSKSTDSFIVGFQSPLSEDVVFKWWIVN